MAKAVAMSAALNEVAGKTSPNKRKRTVAIDDISFSPAKKARTTTKSLRNALTTSDTHRDHRLPLPKAEGDVSLFKTKRIRSLNAKKVAVDSPLKNVPYDPVEERAPGRVNLNESPRKSPRSKFKLPPPQPATVSTPQKRPTRLSVARGEISAPPETWEHIPSRAELKAMRNSRDGKKHIELTETLKANREEAKGPQVEETHQQASSGRKKKLKRPSKKAHERHMDPMRDQEDLVVAEAVQEAEVNYGQPDVTKDVTAQENEDKSLPAATRDDNRMAVVTDAQEEEAEEQNGEVEEEENADVGTDKEEEEEEEPEDEDKDPEHEDEEPEDEDEEEEGELEEEARYKKDGNLFTIPISRPARWHQCYNAWHSIGGAVLHAQNHSRGGDPRSAWCRKFKRRFEQFANQCRQYRAQELSIKDFISELGSLTDFARSFCKEISNITDEEERRKIVLDLYTHTTPQCFQALRNYLKLYAKQDEPFIGPDLKYFIGLLKIAANLCNQAMNWDPRPSTLNGYLARNMQRRIRPCLRRILEKYQAVLDASERKHHIATEMELLESAQITRLEELRKQRENIYRKNVNAYESTSYSRQENGANFYDIDDIELQTQPTISQKLRSVATRLPNRARPRLERQATEEIVPPPMDWSEDEKTALLNALEQYKGSDRYWQISRTSNELSRRSLDELRAAALYFKELVMSAPEFAKEHTKFRYLLNVE